MFIYQQVTRFSLGYQQYPNIERVLIFGSRAKGNYKEGSDIDLALVGKGIDISQLLQISTDIDDTGVLYHVDLIDYNKKKNTPIGDHIDRVGQVFYSAKPSVEM